MFSSLTDTLKLSSGYEIPCVGFGTYLTPDGDTCVNSVKAALAAGYRHIDTAHAYGNERSVGKAVRASGVPRDEVWITSKLWPTEYGEPADAIDRMLKRLDMGRVDLLLLHQQVGDYMTAYKGMEAAVKEGKVRSIGLSNFDGPRLDDILSNCDIPPSVIQVECHPFYQQDELKEKLKPYGTVVESWYPIGHGDRGLIENPVFGYLGRKYGKSNVQAILRWHIQEGNIVFPGSRNPEHIRENLDIFDFSLTDDEMREIKSLDCDTRYYNLPYEQQSQYLSWNPGD